MSTRQTRAFVSILILVLAVLIIVGSCATKKKAISEEDFLEAFSGIWINTDYEPKGDLGYVQKFVTEGGGCARTWHRQLRSGIGNGGGTTRLNRG